jgi:membrane fusion protein, heavy metal efflux system
MKRLLGYAAVGVASLLFIAASAYYIVDPDGRWAGKAATREPHGHGHGAKDEHAHDEGTVELSDARIAAAGIELATAGPGELHERLRLNGVIQANQETLVQVTPRFPGVIREIRKRLGQPVTKGELLARVESNQSLTAYELVAPIDGTVIDRQGTLGEFVSEQRPLFVVADLSTVWVDLSVYRRDFGGVRLGQAVTVDPEDGGPPIQATVSYLSPFGSSDTQSAVARAVVPNDGRLRPGLFVTGRILLSARPVDVAARTSALQTVNGKTVVFVRNGTKFEAREVELGIRDGEHVEVLFGLFPGDVYAAKNSFVIKAELGKASATHEH